MLFYAAFIFLFVFMVVLLVLALLMAGNYNDIQKELHRCKNHEVRLASYLAGYNPVGTKREYHYIK